MQFSESDRDDYVNQVLVFFPNVVLGWMVIRFLGKQVVVVLLKFACLKILILLAKWLTDCCFTCLAYGKAKAFLCSFFWHEKWHGVGYGDPYSMKNRVRRQKARPENGYLRRQQVFNTGNASRLDVESLLGRTLLLSCMPEYLEELSSLNKQVPEGILNTIPLSILFLLTTQLQDSF